MASTQRAGTGTDRPDAYPTPMPFGISVPSGTGAAGTQGDTIGDDSTTVGGQLDSGVDGTSVSDLTNTGAPGSAGHPGGPGPGTVGTVAYTDPGSFLEPAGGSYETDTSDQTSTQFGNKYGSGPYPPGVEGNTPLGTGAGGGRVRRGGFMRGQR